jgi:hypothetical protein
VQHLTDVAQLGWAPHDGTARNLGVFPDGSIKAIDFENSKKEEIGFKPMRILIGNLHIDLQT